MNLIKFSESFETWFNINVKLFYKVCSIPYILCDVIPWGEAIAESRNLMTEKRFQYNFSKNIEKLRMKIYGIDNFKVI